MNKYRTSGEGELQKSQGEIQTVIAYGEGEDGGDESDSREDENTIKLTKDKLSDKIVSGRNEGIEKGQKDTLNTVNEVLGTEFDSVDSLAEGLSEAHVGDIEESEVVQGLQSKLSEKDEKIQNLSQKIQDYRVNDTVSSQISDALGDKKELKLPLEDVKTLHDRDVGYVEKDGELYATKNGERFLNDDGEFTKYSESLVNFAKSKNLIEGTAKGGAGGGSEHKQKDSDNPFETGNLTEQAKLYRNDPERARRLKKAAGK